MDSWTPIHKKIHRELFKGDSRVILVNAPTGVGKTYAICDSVVKRSVVNAVRGIGNGRNILGGPRLGQIRANTQDNFKQACKRLGLDFSVRKNKEYTYYDIGNGLVEWRLVPGKNKDQYEDVMGDSTTLNYIEEATFCDEDYIDAVYTRSRFKNSKMIMSCNASSPYNHVKQKYMDRPIEKYKYITGKFGENPHVTTDYLKKSGLSPHMIKRLIENLWVPAEGVVYDIQEKMLVDRPKTNTGVVVVDPGIGSVYAGLLFEQTSGGWHIADEYYWKAAWDGELTDEQHLNNMLAKWTPSQFIVDPSGVGFKSVALKRGYGHVNGNNDVLSGIQATRNALFSGALTIDSECYNLLVEASGYVWHDKLDKPVKENDHAVDCMRYGVMTLMPHIKSIVTGGTIMNNDWESIKWR